VTNSLLTASSPSQLPVLSCFAQAWSLSPLPDLRSGPSLRSASERHPCPSAFFTRVAVVPGPAIFSHKGQKLYDLRGVNIYRLNGGLVGHLSDAKGAEKHLDQATDRLVPTPDLPI
jgi:hypothetical protein